MLIEVTDQHDIYVPRFCYHDKLSVAANCRMCLVDVEKAPKPLPACATPVVDGMVVRTRSKLALEAQKSVMEFLLINHPLDCPICDQGGECELQDLAMGFGSDVSQYQETKRVVKDKNIGPLVQTDLTRCIHCTRCVRFGEEIAGMRELGATGRGENMTIGTYVEKSMRSELSGNVIDICPVGALTSKPFRYSARAWEMQQHRGIAMHDGLGSNVEIHVKDNRVKRVVPGANEDVNEVWLSDRDRFSYEGLYSDDRLHTPMVKTTDGNWQAADWSDALKTVVDNLRRVARQQGGDRIGALVSPSSSNEEYYLLQKLLRDIGCNNIDHRIRQTDFSDAECDAVYPGLGQKVAELENNDAVLLLGCEPRREIPLINLRIRKAALKGARIMAVNPLAFEFNYDIDGQIVCRPSAMVHELAGILKAAVHIAGVQVDDGLSQLLSAHVPTERQEHFATNLINATSGCILLGDTAQSHAQRVLMETLARHLAQVTGAKAGFLGDGGNVAGAWLTGAVPHRLPGGALAESAGLNAVQMVEQPRSAYVLYHVEPADDCINATAVSSALKSAEFVVAFSAYNTPELQDLADVILPIALFAENEGSSVNIEGRIQEFRQAVKPAGEIRPGWRILRKLGNELGLQGFEQLTVADIQEEIQPYLQQAASGNAQTAPLPASLPAVTTGCERITVRPIYATDPLVRRGTALQQTLAAKPGGARVSTGTRNELRFEEGEQVQVQIDDSRATLPLCIDDAVPDGCCYIPAGQPAAAQLSQWSGAVEIDRGRESS